MVWALARPPILDSDFPGDRAAGEQARDEWFNSQLRDGDEPLPPFDAAASPAFQALQIHERSEPWKRALRRYTNVQTRLAASPAQRDAEAKRKRDERSCTRHDGLAGDPAARARMDAEAKRGRERRAVALKAAQEMRAGVEVEQARRRQKVLARQLLCQAHAGVLSALASDSTPSNFHKCASQVNSVQHLCRPYHCP